MLGHSARSRDGFTLVGTPDGTVFLLGGRTTKACEREMHVLWCYDTDTGGWTQMPSAPLGDRSVSDAHLVNKDKHLICFGGATGVHLHNVLHKDSDASPNLTTTVFDIEKEEWSLTKENSWPQDQLAGLTLRQGPRKKKHYDTNQHMVSTVQGNTVYAMEGNKVFRLCIDQLDAGILGLWDQCFTIDPTYTPNDYTNPSVAIAYTGADGTLRFAGPTCENIFNVRETGELELLSPHPTKGTRLYADYFLPIDHSVAEQSPRFDWVRDDKNPESDLYPVVVNGVDVGLSIRYKGGKLHYYKWLRRWGGSRPWMSLDLPFNHIGDLLDKQRIRFVHVPGKEEVWCFLSGNKDTTMCAHRVLHLLPPSQRLAVPGTFSRSLHCDRLWSLCRKVDTVANGLSDLQPGEIVLTFRDDVADADSGPTAHFIVQRNLLNLSSNYFHLLFEGSFGDSRNLEYTITLSSVASTGAGEWLLWLIHTGAARPLTDGPSSGMVEEAHTLTHRIECVLELGTYLQLKNDLLYALRRRIRTSIGDTLAPLLLDVANRIGDKHIVAACETHIQHADHNQQADSSHAKKQRTR